MVLRIGSALVAGHIADAMNKAFPSYLHEAHKEAGCRTWTIRVYCRITGALLLTRAQV